MKSFDLVVCRITNDDEVEGVGYITVHENQGKAIAQIIKDSFIDLLKNKDPRYIGIYGTSCGKSTLRRKRCTSKLCNSSSGCRIVGSKRKYLNNHYGFIRWVSKNVLCWRR